MMNPFGKIMNVVRHWRELRSMPLRLEFVLSDFCNLNCRGCTHYSVLAPREFVPLERVAEEMGHLGRVCGTEVKSAYLIGGETLLYPHLPEAMEALRAAFPSQRLYIFTNGLLIPKMDEVFWSTARRLGFVMAITRYPVNFDYDAAIRLCESNGVETEVFGDRSMEGEFFKFALDPEGRQNARIAHFKCYNRGCVSIVDGRVFPCSISGCVGHLNRAFGTKFEHRDGDSVAVDDVKSAKDILRLRDRPVPFCRYCRQPQVVVYGRSKRQLSEWV